MITREESCVLKAISIIAIILCHFWGWIYQPVKFISLIAGSFCQTGVAMFLLLSGYGIMSSYKTKGMMNYWKRRIYKLYVPFFFISIPQLLLKVWEYRNNIGDMYIASTFLSALGVYPDNTLDGTLWFMAFILMQYLIFWIAFRFFNKKRVQWIAFLSATFLGYIIFKKYFTWVSTNDIYGFSFCIGVILSESNLLNVLSRKKEYFIIICSSILFYILTIQWYDVALIRMFNGAILILIEIIFVHILLACFSLKLKICTWFGKISYELYLTEGIFFKNKILYELAGYNYRGLLLHFFVVIVLSIVLQIIEKFVGNTLISKKSEYK